MNTTNPPVHAGARWPAGVEVKVWHQYFGSAYGEEELDALREVLGQEFQTNGPQNRRFQEEFAAFSGAPHAFTTTSCTAALLLAGHLCGLRPGDEVITTPLTFVSTGLPVLVSGATPVFADVDPRTFTIDPDSVAARITSRARAIFAVHLYGQCCDMDRLTALAVAHGLQIVADAAHAVGATYKGQPSGALGDAAAFSFHSSKNMTTLGEGGMLTTRRAEWAAVVPQLRAIGVTYDVNRPDALDYWLPLPYEADDPGGCCPGNARMSEAQAAVGRVQLRKVDALNARRRAIAHRYTDGFRDLAGITTPFEDPDGVHVYYLYNLLVDPDAAGFSRDELIRMLFREFGVQTTTGYPPVYWFSMYRKRGYPRGLCPVAERVYAQTVTLPLYARMTSPEVDYVIDSVRRAAARLREGR